jgi:hypothetical protein
MAAQAEVKAQTSLLKYLQNFPLQKEDYKRTLIAFGMKQEDVNNLIRVKQELCCNTFMGTNKEWIQRFQTDFQEKLDKLAEKRIATYYYTVLTGTAVSPNPTVDQIIVITTCLAIIRDLLQIYQLKPTTGQSIIILSRAVALSYIGGNIQEWSRNATETTNEALQLGINSIRNELTQIFGTTFVDAIPLIGKAAAPVTAKIAEGTMNALLIQRLGKNIIAQLQPTRK